MGHSASVNGATAAVAADEQYGICVYASILGIPRNEQSVHLGQLDDFAATVTGQGKVPFIASTLPFRADGTVIGGAVIGMGSLQVGCQAARAWRARAPNPECRPGQDGPAPGSSPGTGRGHRPGCSPAGHWCRRGCRARRAAAGRPVTLMLGAASDVTDTLAVPYPVVAKSEAGLLHRAKVGGVLHGIADARVLRSAVAYLGRPLRRSRFCERDRTA